MTGVLYIIPYFITAPVFLVRSSSLVLVMIPALGRLATTVKLSAREEEEYLHQQRKCLNHNGTQLTGYQSHVNSTSHTLSGA